MMQAAPCLVPSFPVLRSIKCMDVVRGGGYPFLKVDGPHLPMLQSCLSVISKAFRPRSKAGWMGSNGPMRSPARPSPGYIRARHMNYEPCKGSQLMVFKPMKQNRISSRVSCCTMDCNE